MGLAVCRGMDLVDNFLLTTRQGYSTLSGSSAARPLL